MYICIYEKISGMLESAMERDEVKKQGLKKKKVGSGGLEVRLYLISLSGTFSPRR